MTHLRQAMLEELQRRNYAKTTVETYIHAVEQFAKHFKRSPDRLTHDHLRTYQAYLLRERKLGPRTVRLHVAALRFFFVKTLRRRYLLDDTPYPKVPRRLPAILTVDEVTRLIDAARNLTDRAMLMVLYSTGMRNAELRHLQVRDIDSRRMLIHIQHGKGGRDRYVPLSATLLETLRVYYRWMRIPRLSATTLSTRLGRLCQTTLRRPDARPALPCALHAPCRDLESSDGQRRRRPRHVSMEGLRSWECDADHDRQC